MIIQKNPSVKKKRSITIDNNLEQKLRKMQSRLIDLTGETWSLSTIINIIIASGLLSTDKLNRQDLTKIKAIIDGKKILFDDKEIKKYVEKIAKLSI